MKDMTTSTTVEMRPATPEEIRRAIACIREIRGELPEEWLLVAPDGRAWKAKPQDLLTVLLPFHPLLAPFNPLREVKL